MSSLIIATDSRGAKLKRYFSKHFPTIQPTISVLPGAKISDIHISLIETVKLVTSTPRSVVVVAAGICNLTQKVDHAGGVQITYQGDTRKRISDLLYQLHTLVFDLNVNHQFPVLVICIPPANLHKYAEKKMLQGKLEFSILTTEETTRQQDLLEHDITLINREIIQMNVMQGHSSIRWDNTILKIKIRKRGRNGQNSKKCSYFCYDQLYDGVHPDQELADKWYSYMCQCLWSVGYFPSEE